MLEQIEINVISLLSKKLWKNYSKFCRAKTKRSKNCKMLSNISRKYVTKVIANLERGWKIILDYIAKEDNTLKEARKKSKSLKRKEVSSDSLEFISFFTF